MDHPGVPLLVFDGDCGFCTSAAGWIASHWDRPVRSVPWQCLGEPGLADLGLTVEQAQTAVWWVDESGGLARGHRAIGASLLAGTGWRRRAGMLVLTPPFSWMAAGIYRLVARFRHRLPGGTPACRLP